MRLERLLIIHNNKFFSFLTKSVFQTSPPVLVELCFFYQCKVVKGGNLNLFRILLLLDIAPFPPCYTCIQPIQPHQPEKASGCQVLSGDRSAAFCTEVLREWLVMGARQPPLPVDFPSDIPAKQHPPLSCVRLSSFSPSSVSLR